ncbi:hypothetical protein ABH941_007916 [Streptacidiphilus sp. EB103A]
MSVGEAAAQQQAGMSLGRDQAAEGAGEMGAGELST